MEPVLAFFLSLVLLILVCLLVLRFVQAPLLHILDELCGAGHRARFWTNLYQASLVLGVLFGALLWPPDFHEAEVGVAGVIGMFRMGLFGLLVSLLILAAIVGRWILNHDRAAARVSSPAAPGLQSERPGTSPQPPGGTR